MSNLRRYDWSLSCWSESNTRPRELRKKPVWSSVVFATNLATFLKGHARHTDTTSVGRGSVSRRGGGSRLIVGASPYPPIQNQIGFAAHERVFFMYRVKGAVLRVFLHRVPPPDAAAGPWPSAWGTRDRPSPAVPAAPPPRRTLSCAVPHSSEPARALR